MPKAQLRLSPLIVAAISFLNSSEHTSQCVCVCAGWRVVWKVSVIDFLNNITSGLPKVGVDRFWNKIQV